MTSVITYQPDKCFSIDQIKLVWETERKQTRSLLNSFYEIDDKVIDVSEKYEGDKSNIIIQRRDIYKNYNGGTNLFFLNFDAADKLQELEIHYGLEINIQSIVINFTQTIEEVVQCLKLISIHIVKMSEGEYFFPELKLAVASSHALGGEGKDLAYFYCCKNQNHLL